MAQQKSFARAVFDRDIEGPRWAVLDEAGNVVHDGSEPTYEQIQEDPAVLPVVKGIKSENGYPFAHVVDVRTAPIAELAVHSSEAA